MNDEYLVVRGRVDRAGGFELLRAYSTPSPRRWPDANRDSRLWLHLHDDDGRLLHREPAEVGFRLHCGAGRSPDQHVAAAIKLRPDAAELRLVMDDRLLWARPIPAAPVAKLSVQPGGGRTRRVRLASTFDSSDPDAWMVVAYTWGARQLRVVYRGEPRQVLVIDLDGLPGGRECRLLVSLSNGVRSVRAASRPFAIAPLGPQLRIVLPAARQALIAGVPVTLQASLVDDERPEGARFDALSWFVDGEPVGTGLLASVARLGAGRHEIAVEYRSDPPIRERLIVQAKASEIACADQWAEWDYVSGNT
ncbi:MAG: hypothetical protein KF683_05195 [Rubrivivax sp.]|nr:hypothetical protein [Rubrivivax sp.]